MSLLDTASLIVTPNGYKEGKLYSVIPSDGSGDLSVTRATTATRVNSAGLVELVPYNLLQYSEQLNNGYWTKTNVSVTANSTTAPNGTTTADTITDTASGGYTLGASANVNTGAIVTYSMYCKRSNNDWIYLGIARAGSTTYGEVVSFFNINTGTTGNNNTYGTGVFIDSNIENVGNGWYRCSMRISVPLATAYVVYVGNATTNGTPFVSNIGDATFIWGAQVNEGTLKPYQKTETRLNIPRLDYSNGTCPSILVEPQRTNIALQSSSFNTAPWIAVGTTITPNTQTAPDGTLSGDTYDTSQSILLYQTIPASSGTTYTLSMWVKLGTATNICLVANNTGAWNTIGGQSFDSSDGLNTSTWTRIEWTFTTPFLFASAINVHLGGNGQTGLTQSTGSVYIWGAQLEAGSYSTSYIPTSSASVTRNADVISKTGISSLIGQTEGTILLDFVLKNPLSATNRIISITESDWLSGGSIRLDIDYNQIKADFVNGGSNIGSIIYSTTPLQDVRYKVAIAYKENDCQMYINGVDAGSDTTTGAMPTCAELYLNALGGGFNAPYEASNIYASALWKTRLTNTQLQQLTTI